MVVDNTSVFLTSNWDNSALSDTARVYGLGRKGGSRSGVSHYPTLWPIHKMLFLIPVTLASPSLEILAPKEEILIMTVLLNTGLCLTPGHFISHDTQSAYTKGVYCGGDSDWCSLIRGNGVAAAH